MKPKATVFNTLKIKSVEQIEYLQEQLRDKEILHFSKWRIGQSYLAMINNTLATSNKDLKLNKEGEYIITVPYTSKLSKHIEQINKLNNL